MSRTTPNLLQLQNVSKSFGAKRLFDSASFAVNENEHIGVIGPNGAGKTTLFKIFTEDESLDDGTIVRSTNLRLGYLAQHDQWTPGQSVEAYLLENCRKPIWELKALSIQLGIDAEMFEKPVTALSGGYRMRVKLLYLIGQEPNLMLLDEPTNYLDLETTLILERFLRDYEGAFLLISHDREFLRRTTDHIVEVEQGEITKYNGNLDDYFEQKSLLRSQLEARAMSVAQKRQQVLDFVARFGAKATKARQAQSRLKSLDRMETIDLKPLPVSARIQFPAPTRAGKLIADIKNASFGYGEKVVLKNLTLQLINGDHLAVVGLNGAGKSTFLKSIAQVLKPLRGELELGYQVRVAYYAQHVAEGLSPKHTVIEAMTELAHPEVSHQEGLNLAGALLFSGEDMNKKISVLSGGEKSRVALGRVLLQKSPCLVLDEPTNHLDFQTVEALTQALMDYQGTVVVVSHDRSFIRRVAKKVLEIDNGEVRLYPGTYDEYVWSLEKGILSQAPSKDKAVAIKPNGLSATPILIKDSANYKEAKKTLDRDLRKCEKKLAELEENLVGLNEKLKNLNEKITTASSSEIGVFVKELTEVQKWVDVAEAEWLQFSEQKETAELALKQLTGGA